MQRFEQLVVSNVVKMLTEAHYHPTQFEKAKKATITVEGASMRFTTDGNTPTTAIGHLVASGDCIELESSSEIKNFKAIRTGASDATLNISYGFGV